MKAWQWCLVLCACGRSSQGPSAAVHEEHAAEKVVERTTEAGAPRSTKLVPDEAVGPLIASLSENPGDFPSDNYVTNETSLLHVARALGDPRLKRRAYVGVGPEQSFSYLALLEPEVAYIVDIRRGNMLEHLFFRGCFEAGATRAEFLSALVARRVATPPEDLGGLLAAFRSAPMDPGLRDAGVARTKALLDRLKVVRAKGDDASLLRIQSAFAQHGLGIAYSMANSGRHYPPLAETLALAEGDVGTFLATEASYARVRRLVMENRVVPVVGDFGGTHALRAVGDDMRAHGVSLGVFYTSNVEQYLFDQGHHGRFLESVASMPHDDASLFVRVWFDQGKPHPTQRANHRTTQLTMPVSAVLEKKAFRSYWEVVTQPAIGPAP